MATIDSVKLPDNSTYDLTDNYSGYAKKVAGATTDDLASLTATGDLADSGKKLSDLVLKSDVKDVLNSTSTTDPLSANQGRVLEQQAEAGFNVLGAKNLGIPLEEMAAYHLSTSNNSDGSLTVTTNGLMCGGVNTNWSSPFILKKGTYQVSFGLDTDETPSLTGFAVILKVYSTSYWLCTSGDSAASRKITLAADTEVVWGLYCESGTVVATQTVYPMIRDARILDPTFAPYAKTNLQLTNDKAERNDLSTIHATGSTNTTGAQIDAGKFFYLNGQFCKALTNIAANATFTLNTNFKVDTVGAELKDALDYSGSYMVQGIPYVSSYGNMYISLNLPIPQKLRNLYSYSITDISIGGGFSGIPLTFQSGDGLGTYYEAVKLTNTLVNYFTSSGAIFTSISDLVTANASITLTVVVS